MADLSTHYKERTPEETVQIIRDFFESKGFKLKITQNEESEAGTWYCHVDLYKGDYRLDGSNGKGVSEIYSLASGHAELYERFCNGMMFGANPWWNKSVIKMNQEKHGYSLRADEKKLTYEEVSNNCYRTGHFLSTACGADQSLQKATVDYITDGQYIGLPMYNIADENDILYMDPRMLLRISHSIGMAAGNTLDEALNQGISELMEKHAQWQMFQEWDKVHYAINLDKIENPNLKDIIKKIEALDYKLYLVDLSYNYKVPVMMSILVDKKYNTININFGSFPVFDIAAERVLTELYQGHDSYRNSMHLLSIQQPYRTFGVDLLKYYGNAVFGDVLPETFLDYIEYKDTYNHEVFIDEHKSNSEIRKYYSDLGKSLNMKFYYLNNSLSKDMYAIHILNEGENTYTGDEIYDNWWDKASILQAKKQLQKLSSFYNKLYNNKMDYIEFLELITYLNNSTSQLVHNFLGQTRMWNDFLITQNNGNQYNNFSPFITSDSNGVFYNIVEPNMLQDVMNTILYVPFKKYILLKQYIMCGAYTSQEILNIFNNFFNYNLTEEDINKCGNSIYMLKKVYVEPMQEYLQGEEYKQIIEAFVQ